MLWEISYRVTKLRHDEDGARGYEYERSSPVYTFRLSADGISRAAEIAHMMLQEETYDDIEKGYIIVGIRMI